MPKKTDRYWLDHEDTVFGSMPTIMCGDRNGLAYSICQFSSQAIVAEINAVLEALLDRCEEKTCEPG